MYLHTTVAIAFKPTVVGFVACATVFNCVDMYFYMILTSSADSRVVNATLMKKYRRYLYSYRYRY